MLGEINNEFYCSANCYTGGLWCRLTNRECLEKECSYKCYHRKFPTPEQYKKEYGAEYPEDGAVYAETGVPKRWYVTTLKNANRMLGTVCACTPFGKPPDNWRPGKEG